MGSRIAKFVKKAAKDRRLMVSNYLKRLAREEMERAAIAQDIPDSDGVVITREEIQQRLEAADDPRNCIAHETVSEFLKHFDELTISSR